MRTLNARLRTVSEPRLSDLHRELTATVFRPWRTAWLVCGALLALPLATSCKVDEAQQVKVVTADSPPPAGPKPEKGIVIQDESDVEAQDIQKDEESPESLAMRQKSKRTIIIKPGETPQLLAEWSSTVPEDLKALNDGKPFQYGKKWSLSLTAAEYDEFERKRKEHWDKKKNELYSQFDIKLVEYTLKRSDTMESIARKNKIGIWFLALHNPTVDPYALSPGSRVYIPVLMARKKPPAEDAEGAGTAEEGAKGAKGAKGEAVKGAKGKKKGKDGEEPGAAEETGTEEGIPIIVKRGESLGVYTKWGGFTMEDLERLNPGIGSRMLKEGDTVRIPLSPEQLGDFQEKRAKGRKGKPTITPPGDLPPKESPTPSADR